MENRTFYNEILTDHNMRPGNKRRIDGANLSMEGINPSCGDHIVLELKEKDGIIVDGGFQGDGCAVSQASADIMLDLIIGRTKKEALALSDIFMRMIKGEASEEEIDRLEEASALRDISHMPARVKCAVLGWHTFEELAGEDL
ncbi:MAG: SUF system NifU family Fe-S cluster assembly protein [Lachnospiraceae bacterium]|nr:SUF system NifU family Fe-S cluster assembly protein [Lachnospiraceae bacterium]